MRTAHGTVSNDYKYTFLERFGGLGQKEVNAVFGDLKTLADKNIDDINVNDVKSFAAKYRKLAEQIGISSDVVDWEAVEKEIDVKLQNIDELKEEIGIKNAVAAGAGIALALTVVGIVASAIVTGGASLAGTITASYAAGSLVSASINTANEVKALEGDKKAQEDALKQMYLNSLTSMVSEVNAKKREQQIREYQSQR